MSKANTWENLDCLALRWFEMPEEGNEAAKKALENEIFCMLYQLLPKKVDAIGEFWARDWKAFDPKRQPFSSYAQKHIKYRAVDTFRKDNGCHSTTKNGKKEILYNHSLDEILDDPETENSGVDRDESIKESDSGLILDERAWELIVLMLELPARLRGRANNPDRINYFRLFFTDGVTRFIRDSGETQTFFMHERDLFRAMKESFLDFFLAQECRTVRAIFASAVKAYGELVEGRPMDPVKQPLPNDVYISYLGKIEQRKAGPSAVTQQRQAYRQYLEENLC